MVIMPRCERALLNHASRGFSEGTLVRPFESVGRGPRDGRLSGSKTNIACRAAVSRHGTTYENQNDVIAPTQIKRK